MRVLGGRLNVHVMLFAGGIGSAVSTQGVMSLEGARSGV